jgi:hypothetical protein
MHPTPTTSNTLRRTEGPCGPSGTSVLGEQFAQAIAAALLDLEHALAAISPRTYQSTLLDPAFASTVGKHVRHTIDHVWALRAASEGACACYESRSRGTAVETDLPCAISDLREARAFLDGLRRSNFAAPIAIELALFRNSPPAAMASTLERELAFVHGHTIHHMAIIRMLIAQSDEASSLPSTFGYAPGTPIDASSATAACAQERRS